MSGSELDDNLQVRGTELKLKKKILLRVLGPWDFYINFHMVFEEKSMTEQYSTVQYSAVYYLVQFLSWNNSQIVWQIVLILWS